ncbi:MAG TPA: Ig-like domain-containing protein [Acidobacteriaceae bacterium]|nr:Ig-like domain-containing protein [Acidobacteriaceae bacterium]
MSISAPQSPLGSTHRHHPSSLTLGIALLAALLATTLAGCGAGKSAPPPQKNLKTIAVTPATANLAAGATQQFTATATYTDGSTSNVTSTAKWAVASSTVAGVSSSGMVTAAAAGSTTVTASLDGFNGTASITVTSGTSSSTLSSIAVSPAAATFTVGATQQFTATGTYSDGTTANITSQVTWTSSITAAATISSGGLATGVAAGSSTITASLSGVSGTASATVTAGSGVTMTSIAVTPSPAVLPVGSEQQFTATATYSNGSTQNVTSSASWSGSNSAVAVVYSSGMAQGASQGTCVVTASLDGVSGTANLSVKTVASLAVTPTNPSVAMGSTQQFTATATYTDGTTGNVTDLATWSAGSSQVATINASGLATAVDPGTTYIQADVDDATYATNITVVNAPGSGEVDIPTWHVDNNRSGLNSGETILTPGNVNSSSFGKLFSIPVNGYAYAEPLILSNVQINGGVHNVLYVATEADWVYAFDADTGQQLWGESLLNTGETPLTNGAIQPYQGITSTPVIDRSTGTLYVVSAQKTTSGATTFRLHALDITNGSEKFEGPATITASVPGTNPGGNGSTVTLTTSCVQRAALLLVNSNIYIGFGGCPTGWLLDYSALNLTQEAVFNMSPNLAGVGPYASAGGVWMGSGGPVADSSGNVYVVTGNGPWDGNTAWGDSVLKFSPSLQLEDYFTPAAYEYMDCDDADFASGGLLMIPGTADLVAGGKIGKLFLLNSGNLGHEQANDAGALDTTWFEADLSPPYTSQPCTYMTPEPTAQVSSYEIFGTSAYFNGYVYLGITPTDSSAIAPVRQFAFSSSNNTLTPGAYATPSQGLDTRGTTPFISSNGTQDGIVWMINEGMPLQEGTPTAATLYAYDAQNFPNQLYNSNTNSADVPGYGIKFTSPVVADGKVYISTGHDLTTATNPQGEIDVYGLK